MTLSPYEQLKRQVILSANLYAAHTNLDILKNLFRELIYSPRRFEEIKTLNHLLLILETRDILSEDNVDALKEIAHRLANGPELLAKITEYENAHIPRPFVNQYVTGTQRNNNINQPLQQAQVGPNIINNPLGGNLSSRKLQRIFETVTEEIGGSWRQFARNLNIKEGDIDIINQKPIRTTEKVEKVMEIFRNKADPQRWFFTLCDALERTHRCEITRAIQEIMAMNI